MGKLFSLRRRKSDHERDNNRTNLRHFLTKQNVVKSSERVQNKPVVAETIESVFKEAPKIGKPAVTAPIGELQAYLASVVVEDRNCARFTVVHDNNQPVMTFGGKFFYFYTKEIASKVRDTLIKRFKMDVRLIYGPSHKKSGQPVE